MMTRTVRATLALAVVPLVLVGGGHADGAPGGGGSRAFGFLDDVSARSGTDVWAVGVGSATETKTLIQHFDGKSWRRTPSPSPGDYAELLGVDALAQDNAWAGGYATASGVSETCVEHWDGTRWRRVASPSPGGRDSALFDLDARSASDVWGVGYTVLADGSSTTLVEHWDGTRWRRVADASPQRSDQSALEAVDAASAHDVWAVGYSFVGHPLQSVAFTEHWDGHTWTAVPTPDVPGSAGLDSVTVLSPTSVWAAGRVDIDHGDTSTTLTEHWNGHRWAVVPSPNAGHGPSLLGGITGASDDLWTVGVGDNQPLTEHWDGSRWHLVDAPAIGGIGSGLTSDDAVSSSDVWAAGFWAVTPANEKPLVEHWNGRRWSVSER